jgi:hypothetical protein
MNLLVGTYVPYVARFPVLLTYNLYTLIATTDVDNNCHLLYYGITPVVPLRMCSVTYSPS